MEEMKDEHCRVVPCFETAMEAATGAPGGTDCIHELPDGSTVNLGASVIRNPETFFMSDNAPATVQHKVVEAIEGASSSAEALALVRETRNTMIEMLDEGQGAAPRRAATPTAGRSHPAPRCTAKA